MLNISIEKIKFTGNSSREIVSFTNQTFLASYGIWKLDFDVKQGIEFMLKHFCLRNAQISVLTFRDLAILELQVLQYFGRFRVLYI